MPHPTRPPRITSLLAALPMLLLVAAGAGCGDDDSFIPYTPLFPESPAATPTPVLDPDPPRSVGAAAGRPARVVLPDDYDITRRYPLVILLHGFGANAAAQDIVFRLEVRTTARQFILVLPEGTENAQGQQFWDATPECCNFSGTPVDDVGYLADLMREAMQLYAVDPDRIRLVGHSNGGYMSYRYACEQPVPVDRIAVLAGSTFLDAASCRNPRPVDVVHIHGTADDTIFYEPNPPGMRGVPTAGAEATVARWAERAGCDAEPILVDQREYLRGISNAGNPNETDVLRFAGCDNGRVVELWRGNGGDHIYLRGTERWRDDVAAFLSE